jgi:alpha-tubulin suppressor-like RCC1 family protein
VTRRDALALLAALPFAARLQAQTRSSAELRFAIATTHGLLIEPGGRLRAWGKDPGQREGQPAANALGLGHNNAVDPHTLYAVAGPGEVVAAAASPGKSYAVVADGRVFAWGTGGSGELGITPRAEFETLGQPRMRVNVPTPVAQSFDAVDVSSKDDHVLALARDGSVWAWGRGDSGQLGIGPLPVVNFKTRSARVEPYVPYPVRIPDLGDVTAIGAGDEHSLALMKDGTVRAWGSNKYGQIGDGTSTNRDRPFTVPGVRNAVAIAAGGYRSVAVLADGTVMEWGANHVNLTPRRTPLLLAGARGIRSVVAGGEQVAALTQSGEVMTWGQDAHYETGRGNQNASAPGLVKGVAGVTSLASAGSTTIVVTSSGRIFTWGEVRPWTRPGSAGNANLSPSPILLWLDGLDYP